MGLASSASRTSPAQPAETLPGRSGALSPKFRKRLSSLSCSLLLPEVMSGLLMTFGIDGFPERLYEVRGVGRRRHLDRGVECAAALLASFLRWFLPQTPESC